MKNKLKITIYNREYNLVSEETQEYTEMLAAQIDAGIRQSLMSAPCLSVQEAAVLVALDCMDNYTKAKQNIENIRSQIKDYVDDAAKARMEADEARKENRLLKDKIEKLELELRLRNTFSHQEEEEPMNANDIISKEIRDIIESPVHSSDNSGTVSKHETGNSSKAENTNNVSKNNRTYVGQVNYVPGGNN